MKSKIGLVLAGLYLIISVTLILRDGLFGESFIIIILGFPWTLLLAFFEYFHVEGALLFILAIVPIVLNAIILCGIGSLFEKKTT
jgi:hypothetical protein